MVFSSGIFMILFLPIMLMVYYNPIIKCRMFRNIWLLLTSLFFYAWGEPRFVGIMITLILINWYLAIKMSVSKNNVIKRLILMSLVTLDVGILFIFKYMGFIIDNINMVLNLNITLPSITLPIGISFFTFQIISYILDVYMGRMNASASLLNVAIYISMFPQLVAGPIVRCSTIYHEICFRKETKEDFIYGIRRFVIGLGKKVLLADLLARVADEIFLMTNITDGITVLAAWIGAIAYALQIYFDFSGYSDMAIGLGRCIGFHFEENFKYPYIAKSISDFWKRWHISLTDWFRDYVYIPLGGNRCSKRRHIFNLFIVWLLTGIWHGANWTFILWGLLYFILQLIEKTFPSKKNCRVIGHIYTIFCVTICWVIFRSNSIGEAFIYIGKMFGIGADIFDKVALQTLQASWILFMISIMCCFPWKNIWNSTELMAYRNFLGGGVFIEACNGIFLVCKKIYPIAGQLLVFMIFIISILSIINGNYSPFVYFNF